MAIKKVCQKCGIGLSEEDLHYAVFGSPTPNFICIKCGGKFNKHMHKTLGKFSLDLVEDYTKRVKQTKHSKESK